MNNLPITTYIFDIDGVLTDPYSKKVEIPELFDELVKRLTSGHLVTFNTGRSASFINKEILEPLENLLTNTPTLLRHIIAIAEKGGVSIQYDDHIEKYITQEQEVQIPETIQEQIKSIIQQPPYKLTMFFDDTKTTMVSVEMLKTEMLGTRTFKDFQRDQKILVSELTNLLKKNKLSKKFLIDPTLIATDVENREVGKAFGTSKLLRLLTSRNANSSKYLVFGDSASDHCMLEELERLNKQAKMIFVGDKKLLNEKSVANVHFTHNLLNLGTLEYLRSESV